MRSKRVVAAAVAATVTVLVLTVIVATRWGGPAGDDALGGDQTPVRSLDQLAGRWTAVNDTTTPAPFAAPIVLAVDGDLLQVSTGCNSGSGTVAVEDSRLVIADTGLAVTEMGCLDPAVTAQEGWVLDMLAARPRLETAGPYLALHWGPGERFWLGLERETPTAAP
ncbi:META domain-containing protein [uncultured Phycicoccus sp.]|uniref:META domain-containing protein n=1 Tax=uncultured Phycicoccus sp. TaxID=661422 RepID=UPI00261272C3|nr:META domain-containing protein [uncultured Phycicoccus sp.]